MATTREQFIALRKSGKTPEEARKEVMGTVAPTTPSPTASINQMQYEINKQNRQNMANNGEIPAVGTSVTPQAGQTQAPTPTTPPPAPVTLSTTPNGSTMNADGTVTPTTPAPTSTPTPAPETPKLEAPTSTPVTPTAVTPAVDKVSETKAKNEAQMALNKQQAELKQVERDKLTAEANNQLANNEGAILASLKTGGVIPESVKTSPFYKSAQQTYNKLQQYSTYSTNELVTAMNQGSIVPGTNVYNEMMKDPVMKQKLTDAQIYRAGDPVNSTQIYENASTEIMSNNPTTANYLADGVITQAEYDQATNNAQVVAKAKEVEEKANKYNTLKAEYDSIEDEVNAQFPGSPFADSIIADRQKAKYKNLVLAKGEWETATGTLTELKSQASTLFETNLNLAEKRREEENKIAAEERAVQRSKDALQYEADFNKKQAQEALNDPAVQIKATMDEFAKLGIVAQGDLTSKIAEFKASGKTLPEYITGLRQQFMSKPEYKKIQELQAGQLSDVEKFRMQTAVEDRRDARNFAQQKELARLNKDLSREQFLFELENDPEKRAKALELEQKLNANKSLFDVLGKNVGTYEGNRGYDLAGNLGDPLPAGGNWTVKSVDTAGEQVGSIFVGGKGSKPYGNTVVMQDENGNEIRYSHLQTIGVKPGDVLGFGDIVGTRGNTGNVMGANGEKLTAEQLKAGRGAHLDVEIKSNGKLLSNADQVKFLKGLKAGGSQMDANALAIANGVGALSDLTATDKKTILPQLESIINSRMTDDKNRNTIVKSALYNKDVSDSTLQKMTDMQTVKSQLDGIESRLSKQNVGPILGRIRKLNPYDTEAQVALAELAGITPKVARGIFGEVGVLTDADIENYQRTLPNLTSTDDKNKFVVQVMRDLLAKGVMNTIETQARGQRNMSPFLDVYDDAKSYLNKGTQTQNTTQNSNIDLEFDNLYNSL